MDKKTYDNDIVSIIVPFYNSEKVLSECIESVLKQSYSKWELIMINDGSTDDSEKIISRYKKNEDRIKLINQPRNMGVAAARNRGIEESHGRYIAFLDSDDLWIPNKLECQLKFMRDYNYPFTYSSYEMFHSSGTNKTKIINVPESIEYEEYMKNTIIGNLTVVMDQMILGKIKVEHGELEDVLTWMKYLKKGHTAYGINEVLARYRVSENSVSGNKLKNSLRYYNLLRYKQNINFPKSLCVHMSYSLNAIKKRL